mgnify:CR=1 FL=1
MENNTTNEVVSNVNYEELIADIDVKISTMLLMAQRIHEKSEDRKIMAYVLTIFQSGEEAQQMLNKLQQSMVEES